MNLIYDLIPWVVIIVSISIGIYVTFKIIAWIDKKFE
jgi:hypothetical protein